MVLRRSSDRIVKGGIVAGILGGVVSALWGLLGTLLQKTDPWLLAKGASAPFLGERAMRPGFDATAVLVGVLSHFGISIFWGLGFALLFYGLSLGRTLVAGVVWGVVTWLVMFYVVLPAVGLREMAESVPTRMAILEHVVFGLAVALGFLPFQRPEWRPRYRPEMREPPPVERPVQP